jgi:hypothetical protein
VLDRQNPLAGLGQAVPLYKAAIADIKRSIRITEIAEDIGPLDSGEQFVQLFENQFELVLVLRINSDQFPTVGAVGGL